MERGKKPEEDEDVKRHGGPEGDAELRLARLVSKHFLGHDSPRPAAHQPQEEERTLRDPPPASDRRRLVCRVDSKAHHAGCQLQPRNPVRNFPRRGNTYVEQNEGEKE